MRRSLSRTFAAVFICAGTLVPVRTYAQETVVKAMPRCSNFPVLPF